MEIEGTRVSKNLDDTYASSKKREKEKSGVEKKNEKKRKVDKEKREKK